MAEHQRHRTVYIQGCHCYPEMEYTPHYEPIFTDQMFVPAQCNWVVGQNRVRLYCPRCGGTLASVFHSKERDSTSNKAPVLKVGTEITYRAIVPWVGYRYGPHTLPIDVQLEHRLLSEHIEQVVATTLAYFPPEHTVSAKDIKRHVEDVLSGRRGWTRRRGFYPTGLSSFVNNSAHDSGTLPPSVREGILKHAVYRRRGELMKHNHERSLWIQRVRGTGSVIDTLYCWTGARIPGSLDYHGAYDPPYLDKRVRHGLFVVQPTGHYRTVMVHPDDIVERVT